MNDDRFMGAPALPGLTGVGLRTWRSIIAKGEIPVYRVGSRVLVRWSEVVAYLEGKRAKPAPRLAPGASEQARAILAGMSGKDELGQRINLAGASRGPGAGGVR
jgi:excisionase family DNA binding protein